MYNRLSNEDRKRNHFQLGKKEYINTYICISLMIGVVFWLAKIGQLSLLAD